MRICAFIGKGFPTVRLGLVSSDSTRVIDLDSMERKHESLESMILEADKTSTSLEDLIESTFDLEQLRVFPLSEVRFALPLVPPEVWGAGVTYTRSREAREVETTSKGLYSHVYEAERPEIFFKATGSRCVGPGDDVFIRSDSKWSVPEPELSIVLTRSGRILGYTIGNDMSARDIEGQNPLYLPQAKIFKNCCSIGPVLATPDEIGDPRSLEIRMKIIREGREAFEGSVSCLQLKRNIKDLVSYLCLDNAIPSGSVLMTGTGIVPPDDFALRDHDSIEIQIDKIGTLTNHVRQL